MPPETHLPPDEGEEIEHYDDAVIGKALRWSALALSCLLAIAAATFFYLRRQPAAPPPQITQLQPPLAREFSQAQIPTVKFTDITSMAGIHFTHNNGATGNKLLPETMGGGAGFFDYDNDGDQDVLLVNSTWWPGQVPEGQSATTAALYENDGKGNFRDVTAGSGLDTPIYGMGPAFGDFNGDNLVDVFITAVGENRLFQNLGGGRFRDVTAEMGVAGPSSEWSTCAAWFDMDNDGDLDLYVGNYVRWSPDIDLKVGWTLVGIGRAYGQPKDFEGAYPFLYRNEGDNRFTEVSAAAGLQIKNPNTGAPGAKTLGVSPVDVNGDGWMDLVVANDTVPNLLFLNRQDGTFQEIGARAGVAFDSFGATRGAMGIDVARYREDEALGILIGNFANEMTALYVSQPGEDILFTDEALIEGIGAPSRLPLKFGAFFFDYDLDGRQDVLTANGHLEEEISQIQKSQQYRQSAQLFWNSGPTPGGTFAPVNAAHAGEDIFKPIVGRGSAYADIDGDGDQDVLLTQVGGSPLLLRNDQALNHNWLRLRLESSAGNREAIGAWCRVRVNGQDLWRQVMPTRSYLSQSELPVTFGLSTNSAIEQIEVIWPGGQSQTITAPVNQLTVVRRET